MVPEDSKLRDDFETEFSESPTVAAMARASRPRTLTTTQKVASGQRSGGKSDVTEPYFRVSVFHLAQIPSSDGSFFDVYSKSLYDMAHGIANNASDLFCFIFNTGDRVFTRARRDFETNTLLRFQDYRERELMPWQCCKKYSKQLSVLITSGNLRVPIGWTPLVDITEKPATFISEKLQLAGSIGKFYLGHCKLDVDYHEPFLVMVEAMEQMQDKVWDPTEGAATQVAYHLQRTIAAPTTHQP
jgi:hypothetical protein